MGKTRGDRIGLNTRPSEILLGELAGVTGTLKNFFRERLLLLLCVQITKYLVQNCNKIFAALSNETEHSESPKRKKTMETPLQLPQHLQLSKEYVRLIHRKTKVLTWQHRASLKRFSTIDDLHEDYNKRRFDGISSRNVIPREKVKRQKSWEITRGNFSQNMFSQSGNQCTAIAATSIVYSDHSGSGPSSFAPETIDEILYIGEKYYHICRDRKKVQSRNLTADDIAGTFPFEKAGMFVNIEVKEDYEESYHGVMDVIPGEEHTRLVDSLKKFWESHYNYAILTVNFKSLALIKHEDMMYVFDSHSNDINGRTGSPGKACLKKYFPCSNRFQDISADLHNNNSPSETLDNFSQLALSVQEPYLYSVTPLTITKCKKPDGSAASSPAAA